MTSGLIEERFARRLAAMLRGHRPDQDTSPGRSRQPPAPLEHMLAVSDGTVSPDGSGTFSIWRGSTVADSGENITAKDWCGTGAASGDKVHLFASAHTDGRDWYFVLCPKLDNLVATTDPTVDDDTLDGYTPGSIWLNGTSGILWFAQSVGAGAAVWWPLQATGQNGSSYPKKVTINHDDLHAASTTASFTYYTLKQGEILLDVFTDTSTVIPPGDGFTQYDVAIDYNLAFQWISNADFLTVSQAATATTGLSNGIVTGNWASGTAALDAIATANQNTNLSTGGQLDVYMHLIRF